MAKVKVTNRNRGSVGYEIPDKGVVRTFEPGSYKMIDEQELQDLQFVPGGEFILRNYLIVESEDTLKNLNIETEPEYFYTEEDVRRIMMDGSVDEMEDLLNFAPDGLNDMIKTIAVEIQLPDNRKRDLIFNKLGFNVSANLEINKIMESEIAEESNNSKPIRKVAKPAQAAERKATPIIIKK